MEAHSTKIKGFTIVEVTILVVVVALFLSALLPLVTQNMVTNNQSKTRNLAYEAAYKKVEELRNTSFDSLASGSFTTSTVPRGSGSVTLTHDVNKNGTVESAENDIVLVTVNVDYTEKEQTKTVTISSIIIRGGISN